MNSNWGVNKILEKVGDIISCGKYHILPLWRLVICEVYLTGRGTCLLVKHLWFWIGSEYVNGRCCPGSRDLPPWKPSSLHDSPNVRPFQQLDFASLFPSDNDSREGCVTGLLPPSLVPVFRITWKTTTFSLVQTCNCESLLKSSFSRIYFFKQWALLHKAVYESRTSILFLKSETRIFPSFTFKKGGWGAWSLSFRVLQKFLFSVC